MGGGQRVPCAPRQVRRRAGARRRGWERGVSWEDGGGCWGFPVRGVRGWLAAGAAGLCRGRVTVRGGVEGRLLTRDKHTYNARGVQSVHGSACVISTKLSGVMSLWHTPRECMW